MNPESIRDIATRWGWDPDKLTTEQREDIETAIRDWADLP